MRWWKRQRWWVSSSDYRPSFNTFQKQKQKGLSWVFLSFPFKRHIARQMWSNIALTFSVKSTECCIRRTVKTPLHVLLKVHRSSKELSIANTFFFLSTPLISLSLFPSPFLVPSLPHRASSLTCPWLMLGGGEKKAECMRLLTLARRHSAARRLMLLLLPCSDGWRPGGGREAGFTELVWKTFGMSFC